MPPLQGRSREMIRTATDLHDALYRWFSKGTRFTSGTRFSLAIEQAADGPFARLRFWTSSNCYSIRAIPARDEDGGKEYLGCEVTARSPLPGEHWTRGADLADGEFSEATLARILLDIVSYEAQEIVGAAN